MAAGPACSSSEETGAAQRAEHPRQEQLAVQDAAQPVEDSTLVENPQSAGSPGTPNRAKRNPRVRRGQDTVRVSTSRSSKGTNQRTTLKKPPNAMYTVQVGAFRRAPYALELQRTLKNEYVNQPVFSLFLEGEGLYKVTIGKFETLREASSYRRELLATNPEKFSACWVTYIERSR
jgi:cell division septation protein DedD